MGLAQLPQSQRRAVRGLVSPTIGARIGLGLDLDLELHNGLNYFLKPHLAPAAGGRWYLKDAYQRQILRVRGPSVCPAATPRATVITARATVQHGGPSCSYDACLTLGSRAAPSLWALRHGFTPVSNGGYSQTYVNYRTGMSVCDTTANDITCMARLERALAVYL